PLLKKSFDREHDSSFRSVVGQRLVECYFIAGDEENGLAIVQKLRGIAPDDPDILYTASKVYANLWNQAVQRMLAKTPESFRVHQVWAEVLETQEKYAEAANEYRQILKLAPQLPGVHYRLGRMLLRSETSDADEKALAEFQRELKNNSADVAALSEVGEIYLKRNQLDKASQSFARAVDLQPGYVPARVGLAKTLIAEKELSKALEHLEAAAKLAPKEETVPYNLMIVYRGLGRAAD